MKLRILCIIGTRPEAIKLAPLILHSKNISDLNFEIYLTGQHTDLIIPILEFFDLKESYVAVVNREFNTVNELMAQVLQNLCNDEILNLYDGVIVQGDTTSALSGALAAFHEGKPVFHIEAGLRSGDMKSPFPEEMNRILISRLATIHFCPTEGAVDNLIREGYSTTQIELTGNTVVDNCHNFKRFFPKSKLLRETSEFFQHLNHQSEEFFLVTCHRRENQQSALDVLCDGLLELVSEFRDINIVFVMHANPKLKDRVINKLGGISNIFLVNPLPYQDFVYFIMNAKLIITDSGGIQEEAPSFNTPVMIFREETERLEVLKTGGARLIGTNRRSLLHNLRDFLQETITFNFSENPFGDGTASQRIINRIVQYLKNG